MNARLQVMLFLNSVKKQTHCGSIEQTYFFFFSAILLQPYSKTSFVLILNWFVAMTSHYHHGISNHCLVNHLLSSLICLTTNETSKLCITGPLWGESTRTTNETSKLCITGPLWGESTRTTNETSKLCITGPLWGESTSDWWIPLTKGQ